MAQNEQRVTLEAGPNTGFDDQSTVAQENLQEQRLKQILISLDQLNINIAKMEKSLADMLNGGVKVKWLK